MPSRNDQSMSWFSVIVISTFCGGMPGSAASFSTTLPTGTVVRDYVTDLTWVSHVRFDMSGSASPAGTSAIGDPDVLCMP